MTITQARKIIATYAEDAPSAGAAERLAQHDESEFSRLLDRQPGASDQ